MQTTAMFQYFCLDDWVPADHLLRAIDRHIDLRAIREQLRPLYSEIGRQLYPLMLAAGLESVRVSPRMVYVDSSRPDLVEGFTKNTFTAMIEGVCESAVATGLIQREAFNEGIRDLRRTAEADGVFCYSFFKGIGKKQQRT